jgi:CRP/FNR family transcriptional regulator, cyclic AMP receptor protein
MSAPVFDPKTLLAGAAEGGSVATYQARQVIFAQGDPADAVFFLMAGRVKRTVVSEEGKEAVVAILAPGEFFGEGCLSGKTQRKSSGIAMEECTIARVEKSVLVRLLHEETTFSEMFITYLVKRNQRIEADLADQMALVLSYLGQSALEPYHRLCLCD